MSCDKKVNNDKTVLVIFIYYIAAIFFCWLVIIFGIRIYFSVFLLLRPMSSPIQLVIPAMISVYAIINRQEEDKRSDIIFLILVIHLAAVLNIYLSRWCMETLLSAI